MALKLAGAIFTTAGGFGGSKGLGFDGDFPSYPKALIAIPVDTGRFRLRS
jgi:hypothetical protein